MRVKLFPLLVVCLICAFSGAGQTVIENASEIRFREDNAMLRLAVESGSEVKNVQTRISLLDTEGNAVRTISENRSLKKGRQFLEFSIPLAGLSKTEHEDLAWYRVRYAVGDMAGVISVSQIASELFEMRVIATDNLLSGMVYRIRAQAVNPFTEMPAENVAVEALLKLDLKDEDRDDIEYRAEGVTDADGFAVMDIAITPELLLDGDGSLLVKGRRNGIVREATESLDTLSSDTQFLMMTDKPIYQPGQMINLRGVLFKGGESKVVRADAEIEFRIEDEDETLVYREKTRTSGFGVAAIGWRIPANVRLGNFMIEVRDGDGDLITSTRVRVSRYDLPNFVVNAKPSKAYYLPADKEAEIEVKADYLFGKPVTKGKVRVVEETSREWNYKEQKYDIDEGEIREGELDADGKFIARFDLTDRHESLEDDDDRHDDIRFAAYLTDLTTNRTEQRRFDIRVSREPIHVYLSGVGYSTHPELPVVGYISTFYADGTPAECDVEVKASEDDEEEFKTVARVRTNSFGAGKLEIMRPKIGDADDDLDFRLIAKDRTGRSGTLKEKEVAFHDSSPAIRVSAGKSIYAPGEMAEVSVVSTIKNGLAFIDVVKGWTVVDSHAVQLKNGRASLTLPYNEKFKGHLNIAAYMRDPEDDDDIVHSTTGIIFPSPEGIAVKADFDKAIYKPNEEANVSFSVVDAVGQVLESALGIVIMDKAVEERSRTDSEFGSQFRDLGGWLGYGAGFGSINVKDLNELDMTKPISPELQLVGEIILSGGHYMPNIFYSKSYFDEARSVFGRHFSRQFDPVSKELNETYTKERYRHPTNDEELHSILAAHDLSVKTLRDPWETPYRTKYTIDTTRNFLFVESAGPDKTFGTRDDLTAFTASFQYFTPMGQAIDTAVRNYNREEGKFVRDRETLISLMGMPDILDRWGRPYKLFFDGNGRIIEMNLRSAGPDGKFEESVWRGDDFNVWTTRQDFFAPVEAKIGAVQKHKGPAPLTEEEFRSRLREAGITDEMLFDGNGKPLYINTVKRTRFWDKVTLENVQVYGENTVTQKRVITPVTQEIVEFTLRGPGRDGTKGNWDDITFTQVVYVLSERTKDDIEPVPIVQPVSYVGNTGAIAGTVTDPTGAVIAGVQVTATNETTNFSKSVTTNADGRFLIAPLPPGKYTVRIEANGFLSSVYTAISVTTNVTAHIYVTLEVGAISEMVSVVSSSEAVMNTTNSSVGTTIDTLQITALPKSQIDGAALLNLQPGAAMVSKSGEEERETPRLREYFPETLLWRPEVVTDADGKAEVKFRMADNITTWKMYTVASTKDGKVGFAEKEVTAFQSFFVDLDPPKFLTDGDEIFLPTQVRNYTETRQKVDVTMDKADWFTFIDGQKKEVSVDSGQSENAVFGFRAAMPVTEGKQRVTAYAETESDAIERPVTVRPDGREIIATESRYFNGSTRFDIDFPANTLPRSHNAELKIYPNLMAHVAEAVEGLLQRPYGCGEQTISSTYPNLMILKFNSGERKRISGEAERQAMKNLRDGYDRLIGYQLADGGFSYWGGKDSPDLAVTAYALRFLADASDFIAVDESVVKRAEEWLSKQQRADGSFNVRHNWERSENEQRAMSLTTYVARTLAMLTKTDTPSDTRSAVLKKALAYLRVRNSQADDPYSLSLLGLALADSGDGEMAAVIADKVATLGREEAGGMYWNLESNTVFNGWGRAGRIETTALAAQLLMKMNDAEPGKFSGLIGKAMIFLVRNKDRYGVWYSTQTTINVLDAFAASAAAESQDLEKNVDVVVNGNVIRTVEIGPDKLDQIIVELEGLLPSENAVELRSSGSGVLMAQAVSTHYISWQDADSSGRTVNQSRALELDYKCDGTNAVIMQEVTCSVRAERVGFRGYGMLLAEIGTPPGADVSRESLEKALEGGSGISKYEVLPDRIIVYMWARAGGTNFDFKFRPRYGINAQTPASFVYDYYNPEAQAVREPMRFVVR